MRKITIILLGYLFLNSNCKDQSKYTYDSFFEQIFSLIKENSIRKYNVNWDDLKHDVIDSVKHFKSNGDVYKAIDLIIRSINDGHSQFIKPNVSNKLDIDTLSIPNIDSKIINSDIGYIKIPGFMANDSLSHLFALKVRKTLLDTDSIMRLSGWIIDLRGNGGGKSSSMLLGVSPLFMDTLVGYALNNSGEYEELYCKDYFLLKSCAPDSLIYSSRLKNKNIKMAVLVNKNTASAGELLAIALKAQTKSKIIGEKTKGKTSHLGLFTFTKSNAKLLLAMKYYCDNKKNVFKSSINPDIYCSDNLTLSTAIRWIEDKTPYNTAYAP